jgi:hypothetical protein
MPSMQNLQTDANNDTTFALQITQSGNPMNLTGYTLRLYVKASQQALDSSATVYAIGSGLTLTEISGGEFTFVLPRTAATVPGTYWWRIDIVDGNGNVGTALYGNLYILPV